MFKKLLFLSLSLVVAATAMDIPNLIDEDSTTAQFAIYVDGTVAFLAPQPERKNICVSFPIRGPLARDIRWCRLYCLVKDTTTANHIKQFITKAMPTAYSKDPQYKDHISYNSYTLCAVDYKPILCGLLRSRELRPLDDHELVNPYTYAKDTHFTLVPKNNELLLITEPDKSPIDTEIGD